MGQFVTRKILGIDNHWGDSLVLKYLLLSTNDYSSATEGSFKLIFQENISTTLMRYLGALLWNISNIWQSVKIPPFFHFYDPINKLGAT